MTLAACQPALSWWQTPSPCPPGATLTGVPWPDQQPVTTPAGPLTADKRTAYVRHYAVMCRSGDGPQDLDGRSTTWWGNGQMSMELLAQDGGVSRLTEWDERGRETHRRTCTAPNNRSTCTGHRTWWHHTVNRGIEGSYVGDTPVGIWQEWSPEGTLIGEVDFGKGGSPVVLKDDDSRLLFADIVLGGAADLAISRTPDLALPVGKATGSPQIGMNLSLTAEAVLIDGFRLGPWTDPATREQIATRMEGAHRDAKMFAIKARQPVPEARVLLQADAGLSYTEVEHVMAMAQDRGFVHFDLVVDNPKRQLPPFQGPPRSLISRNHAVLSVALVVPRLADVEASPNASLQDMIAATDALQSGSAPKRWPRLSAAQE
jgi:hypothetical protein